MVYHLLLLIVFTLFQSCGTEVEPPELPDPETYFKKGEYGGQELPGTEHLTLISPSPSGDKIALIRERTPNDNDPLYQLWILDADGTDASLITYNTGAIHWHPNGNKLAFTFNPHTTPYTYVFTLNLDTKELKLWNSKEEFFFDKYTSASAGWFEEGHHLLIGVNGKAYQQEYDRGLYILDIRDTTHVGPLKTLFTPVQLGYNDKWVVGIQYTDDRYSSNRALFDLETKEFHWLTKYDEDRTDSARSFTGYPALNPSGEEIILPRYMENAWQLFHIDKNGSNIEQLTELGGHEVRWVRGKDFFIFNRDTHKAPGAKYIPYKYNFAEGTEEPLWPNLPDSVPEFPAFSTQNPIHLINYVD
jgi:hypothetical protein